MPITPFACPGLPVSELAAEEFRAKTAVSGQYFDWRTDRLLRISVYDENGWSYIPGPQTQQVVPSVLSTCQSGVQAQDFVRQRFVMTIGGHTRCCRPSPPGGRVCLTQTSFSTRPCNVLGENLPTGRINGSDWILREEYASIAVGASDPCCSDAIR